MKAGLDVVSLRGWARTWGGRIVVTAGAAAATLGCSDLASGSDRLQDPLQDSRVPGWECLDGPAPTLPTGDPPQYVAFVAPILDFANPPNGVPDLSVSVCQIMDAECPPTKVVGKAIGPTAFMTVLQGAAVTVPLYTIVVPYRVEAYLRLTAPGYLRQEYYFGGPLIGTPGGDVMKLPDGTSAAVLQGLPLNLVKESDADYFASQLGVKREADQGIIAVRTVGCSGLPSAGVTLRLDPAEGLPFSYLSGFALASSDPPRPTDENGLAGFANIELPNSASPVQRDRRRRRSEWAAVRPETIPDPAESNDDRRDSTLSDAVRPLSDGVSDRRQGRRGAMAIKPLACRDSTYRRMSCASRGGHSIPDERRCAIVWSHVGRGLCARCQSSTDVSSSGGQR